MCEFVHLKDTWTEPGLFCPVPHHPQILGFHNILCLFWSATKKKK